jgi:hypothetical protein
MKPGTRRSFVALNLTSYPSAGIAALHYDVERKSDAGSHRVFAVTTSQTGTTFTGELVIDTAGFVVSQTFGPPINLTFTRRPQ